MTTSLLFIGWALALIGAYLAWPPLAWFFGGIFLLLIWYDQTKKELNEQNQKDRGENDTG